MNFYRKLIGLKNICGDERKMKCKNALNILLIFCLFFPQVLLMDYGAMYDMNQIFRLVQAVTPILTCKKKILFFFLIF